MKTMSVVKGLLFALIGAGIGGAVEKGLCMADEHFTSRGSTDDGEESSDENTVFEEEPENEEVTEEE